MRTASLWRGMTRRRTMMSALAAFGLGAAAYGITRRQMNANVRAKQWLNWKFWR